MNNEITLSKQELDELKDTIKFREKVILKLKQLNGIPDRVKTVETKMLMLLWGIPIVGGIIFAIFRAVAR